MNQPGSIAGNPRAARPQTTVTTDGPAPLPSVSRSDRVPALAWFIAAVFVAVELAFSGRYAFMQDELYFIAAGHYLAFGYVDQPPLSRCSPASRLRSQPDSDPGHPGAGRRGGGGRGGQVRGAVRRWPAGRVLAALTMACAPVLLGADHVDNTTPLDLLAWTAVLLCVTTALLRDRPRWWLAPRRRGRDRARDQQPDAPAAPRHRPGVLLSQHAAVLRTRWPWLGAGIAAVIWAPNLIWQATHGWPQLAMASALHQQYTTLADYLGGVPAQLVYVGLVGAALVIAGCVRLWRTPELRFIAVAVTLVVVYVLAWVPGKAYYTDGLAPAVLAAGSLATEHWVIGLARRAVRNAVFMAVLATTAVILPVDPAALDAGFRCDIHNLQASAQHSSNVGDTVGCRQRLPSTR